RAVRTAWALSPAASTVVELGPASTLLQLAQRFVPDPDRQWIASSQALHSPRGRRLFRHVPLGWTKPVARAASASAKPDPQARPATPDDCVYETSWVSLLPVTPRPAIDPTASCLVLSRCAIASTVAAAFSAGWQLQVVTPETADTVLRPLLAAQPWSTVAVLGTDDEADVALGLRVLQLAGGPDLRIDQVVFATAPDSDGDVGLWGLARSFRLERPELRLRSVACLPAQLPDALAWALSIPAENELAVDADGVVRALRLGRCSDLTAAAPLVLRSDATYVISGGLGALGLVVARQLIDRGATHLVLLSRNPAAVESTPALATLRELRTRARVECLACDVSREASVQDIHAWLQREAWPAVRGVVHAAGVLTDATIPNQSADKLARAFGAKVHGARHLRRVFTPPDFLVLFSSVAASFGSAGQASYAAANATLDALAHQWSSAGEPVLSIQWGAWSDAGMATRHDAVKRAIATGLGAISNALGAAVLERLLAAGKRGTVCVSPIDWNRLELDLPLLARLKPKARPAAARAHDATELLAIVREAAAEAIGAPIADDASLLENGLNSLGSVSLRNRLASRLRVELPAAFVFECPDITAMVRYLAALSPYAPPRVVHEPSPSGLPVLVIGAGIGGLGFARQLEKAGVPVVVMDTAARVGGVWQSLANTSSKLQIDSPAYDFDSTTMPVPGERRWKASFPLQAEILDGCRDTAAALAGPVHLGARVQHVRKTGDAEYEVDYQCEGRTQRILVSGVAAMTGGLHRPRTHTFANEDRFAGHIGLGIANDTPLATFDGASVVIVGHGAFAIENMRTALENGASHVTIVCRRQNLVLSTFCNWLINSSKGVMTVTDVVNVMRPFYEACGIDIEGLQPLARDPAGDWTLDQTTVPPGSDLYFLAQILGKLRIVVGEVASLTPRAVVTTDGQAITADVFLKCLGSDTDDSVLLDVFGPNSQVHGLWINGDPNLFTYNDGAQAPRKVKSLMCASYAFFVQAFVPAYLHFRQHRDEHARALARITAETTAATTAERVLVELWDFVEPVKRTLAERTAELLPFDRFQVEREAEWQRYSRMLGAPDDEPDAMWHLLRPTLSLMHRRHPHAPIECRSRHALLGVLSVFVPRRRRVLFLAGQGTNARLARTLLERTGWIGRSQLDFVVPDAPYEMPAFTNDEQLEQIGLSGLVSVGLYDKTARYREWRAGFEALYGHHHRGTPIQITAEDRSQWSLTLAYVRELAHRYGPFDGIAGFCEGAAVASVALHLQARGQDHGLGSVRFFIAMAPWRSPMHQQDGLFRSAEPLRLPMLQIVGDNDMDVFQSAAPDFRTDFANADEFHHAGQHVYPPLTPGLELKLRQLLHTSDATPARRAPDHLFSAAVPARERTGIQDEA
ncbi:MAG TPA: SDR family NAD(P)-dependent oxidoreductase, partial [Kofleriaceae bacterium]|nr:SDR family NAD(P)-dependent oxidoreductase [Kofleriaceae bacterium]